MPWILGFWEQLSTCSESWFRTPGLKLWEVNHWTVLSRLTGGGSPFELVELANSILIVKTIIEIVKSSPGAFHHLGKSSTTRHLLQEPSRDTMPLVAHLAGHAIARFLLFSPARPCLLPGTHACFVTMTPPELRRGGGKCNYSCIHASRSDAYSLLVADDERAGHRFPSVVRVSEALPRLHAIFAFSLCSTR